MLPSTSCSPCCSPSDSNPVIVNIPGPKGDDGEDGIDGADGISAFTVTTETFVQPAVDGSVVVSVANGSWAAVGLPVFIEFGGFYLVDAFSSTTLTLINLGYPDNQTPGGNVVTAAVVVSCGLRGPAGENGSTDFPDGTNGDLYVRGDTEVEVLAAGVTNYMVPRINTSLDLRIVWELINLGTWAFTGALPVGSGGTGATSAGTARTNLGLGTMAVQAANAVAITGGTISSITDLAIADGGTGASTAQAAINALAGLTTKGDLLVRDSTNDIRVGVGADDTLLTASSAAASGVAWVAPTFRYVTNVSLATATPHSVGSTIKIVGVNLAVAGASTITLPAAPTNGREVWVKDEKGDAASNTITINAGAGDSIQGSGSTTITSNFGIVKLYYRSANSTWYVA